MIFMWIGHEPLISELGRWNVLAMVEAPGLAVRAVGAGRGEALLPSRNFGVAWYVQLGGSMVP